MPLIPFIWHAALGKGLPRAKSTPTPLPLPTHSMARPGVVLKVSFKKQASLGR